MRLLIAVVVALIGGFIAGIVISQLLAFIGLLLVDDPVQLRGLKYVPIILPFISAAVVLIWMPRRLK